MERGRIVELVPYGVRRITVDGGARDFAVSIAQNESERQNSEFLMRLTNGKYPIVSRDILGVRLLLEKNRLYVPEYPWESGSKEHGAKGMYIFRSEYKNPAVQGYILKEGQETSFHFHLRHTEVIQKLYGDAKLILNVLIYPLVDSKIVTPGVKHMVKAGKGGALIVVVTSGSNDCFDREDHHYSSKPQFTLSQFA